MHENTNNTNLVYKQENYTILTNELLVYEFAEFHFFFILYKIDNNGTATSTKQNTMKYYQGKTTSNKAKLQIIEKDANIQMIHNSFAPLVIISH